MKAKTRLRVLVVEDEDEIKSYLKSELSDEYKVETCSNGKEAYDSILRDAPDLVISDVMMPEMDGLTLCRKISRIQCKSCSCNFVDSQIQTGRYFGRDGNRCRCLYGETFQHGIVEKDYCQPDSQSQTAA